MEISFLGSEASKPPWIQTLGVEAKYPLFERLNWTEGPMGEIAAGYYAVAAGAVKSI